MKPKILCVDDEPLLLESMQQVLSRAFDVKVETSPVEALSFLEHEEVQVVVSDMRMPQMDGARFFEEVSREHPDVTRILLTGHSDAGEAARAVNKGRIHQFLTKPCPPPQLIQAIRTGVRATENREAERAILEQTLNGMLKLMLSSITHFQPEIFGHSNRVARVAKELFKEMNMKFGWAEEISALIWPLGAMAHPLEEVQRLLAKKNVIDHLDFVRDLPAKAAGQLLDIPKMMPVIEILEGMYSGERAEYYGNEVITSVMRGCLELSLHLEAGKSSADAVAAAAECVPHDVKLAMEQAMGCIASIPVVTVNRMDLTEGMRLAGPIRTKKGILLMSSGMSLTRMHIERLSSYALSDLEADVLIEKQEEAFVLG